MPYLHTLFFKHWRILDLLEHIQSMQMEQIRTLDEEEQKSYAVVVLTHCFPSLEHLSTLRIKSRSDIIHVVDKFKQLSSVSFYTYRSSEKVLRYSDFEPDLIISEISPFTHDSISCRVERMFF
jgi:hypothetical protein